MNPSGQPEFLAFIPVLVATTVSTGISVSIFLAVLLLSVTASVALTLWFVRRDGRNRESEDIRNDLAEALENTSGLPLEKEKIYKGIVNFGNTTVSAIMCPRMDVTAVDNKWGFKRVMDVIVSSGFSRIPVYSGTFDSIKGILYAKDILPYATKVESFRWQSLVKPPYFVPETNRINDLLKEFQTRKIHMAIVIDEFGGTSGIVTLEDILEEIVGEISDESDEDPPLYKKIDEHTYHFEGKIQLNDFCRVLGIPESLLDEDRGESETLAGLVLELTGEIPKKDQLIPYRNFNFRIESADMRRIKEIIVEIAGDDADRV